MDLNKIAVFGAMKKRLAWLTQRQEVLAQNIANSDTPGYRPRDLKEYGFREVMRRESMHVNMHVTDDSHLGGRRSRISDFTVETERRPYETTPTGNAVVLEEQMAKISETSLAHKVAIELYRKHLRMLKIAINKN